jgi:hypothetical protein
MPVAPDTYLTLSAMITPALFMTATGSLIISTSNRMSRVVDRIRVLNRESDALCRGATELDFLDDRLEHVADQLDRMMIRNDLIRFALTSLYLAMAMFVGTSLTMAVDALIGNYLVALPTTLAILGVSLMLAACVLLTREARVALRNNRDEIRFYQGLRDRRTLPPAARGPTPGG